VAGFDIIIVGAGPAGLSTALHLAQSAPRLAEKTLILEQAHHPRPKLCAGGVLPGGEAYLRGLGLDMSAVPSIPVQEMRLQFEARRYVIRRKPVCFRTVRRDQFDAWLADAAREQGLELREGVRVREVRIHDGYAEVLTDGDTYRARVVVGADGAKGTVRRVVPRRPVSQIARLLEVRLPAVSQDGYQHQAIFDFSGVCLGLQGYVWDFPTPSEGCTMRTCGVYDSRVYPHLSRVSLRETLEQGLARHGRPAEDYQLEGHPFRWFHPRAALAAPHVLLVGDAAGTDPVVGEGISFALGYGEVAAGAVRDAFEHDDFSFAGYRGRVLRHRIGRYLSLRAAGACLLYGLRNRHLLRTIWPAVGWLAEHLMIDWG
jgi:flavin-dependent dehydrogenase